MKYPIRNLQDFPSREFPLFHRYVLELLTHRNAQAVMRLLCGEPATIISTMYFEENQETWAHHDSFYIDSEVIGSMVGIWVAVEDIQAGAGRFYVYARSHLLPFPKLGEDFDLDPKRQAIQSYVVRLIRESNLECRAPALRKGDVLLWTSKTIHRSLKTTQ